MSRREKSMMPQSTAGLVRYFEQSKEAIKIKPEHVLIAAGVFIVLELLIKFM
jgi:preprotein translocase subunit Sec61beta